MYTIKLHLEQAQRAATALLPHISNDDVTPVIMHAHATPNGLFATDRYTVAHYNFPENQDTTPTQTGEEGLIHRDALEYITKITKKQLRKTHGGHYKIQINSNEEECQVSTLWCTDHEEKIESVQTFNNTAGKQQYPPVMRLFDSWEPANHHTPPTINLNHKHVAKTFPYMKKYAKEAATNYTLGGSKKDSDKPQPVKTEYKHETGEIYTTLLQPNLIK